MAFFHHGLSDPVFSLGCRKSGKAIYGLNEWPFEIGS
jgi:hypothetical protein